MPTPDEARAFLALARQSQFATMRVHLNDDSHLLHAKAMNAVFWEGGSGLENWPSLDAFEAEFLPKAPPPTNEELQAALRAVLSPKSAHLDWMKARKLLERCA